MPDARPSPARHRRHYPPAVLAVLVAALAAGLWSSGCATGDGRTLAPPTTRPGAVATTTSLPLPTASDGGGPAVGPAETGPGGSTPAALTLSSPALPADAVADARFSCAGAGVSPPLLWLGVPADTAELAVVVIDLDTPGPFVHWALAGIDPKTTAGLGEGAVPKEVLQARNSTGKPGWQPFCPPVGETHRYQFSLYALGAPSDITALTPAAETVTRLNQEPASVASFTVLFNRS